MDVIQRPADLASVLVGVAAILWETRSGGPIRTIITGRSSRPTGRYRSIKCGRAMPWESLFEERLMRVCEAHPDICSFVSQPHKLEILRQGGNLVYYPDMRIDYSDGSVEIVEVSSKTDRRKEDQDYKDKVKTARKIYEESLGWGFTYVDGEAIGADPAYANLINVERHRRTLYSVRDEAVVAQLSIELDPFPYGRACERLGGYPTGKAILHAMMVRGVVSIDVYDGTINGDTQVSYATARRRCGPPCGGVRRLPGRRPDASR